MTTVIHMHRDNTITARTTPTRILSLALKNSPPLGHDAQRPPPDSQPHHAPHQIHPHNVYTSLHGIPSMKHTSHLQPTRA